MPATPCLVWIRILSVVALACLLVGLLAVPALAAEVTLGEDGFVPATVRVETGEDVVWTNATDEEQTIVGEDGTWDSGPLQPGETFSVALRAAGTVRYATADGAAEGSIEVRAAAAADEGQSEDEDDEAVIATPAELPQTGQPSAAMIGWASILFGLGLIVLRRAEVVALRGTAG